MEEVGINLLKMKNWILKKRIPIGITFLGAVAGFLYWNYVGCASGNCGITANWYTSMAYGSVMGWLVGDFSISKVQNKKNDKQ